MSNILLIASFSRLTLNCTISVIRIWKNLQISTLHCYSPSLMVASSFPVLTGPTDPIQDSQALTALLTTHLLPPALFRERHESKLACHPMYI